MIRRLLFIVLAILLAIPGMCLYILMPPIRWIIKGGKFTDSIDVTVNLIEKITFKLKGNL